ncbi:UBA-like domain-containing protein 1 [Tachysurus ichikawai]
MTLVIHEEDQMEMDSTEMWYIMTRKQQLQARRALLLGLQEFLRKNNFSEGNFNQKEDQGLCELAQIEKELQSLSEREGELSNGMSLQEKQSTVTEITEDSSATGQSPPEEELNSTTPAPEVVEVKDLSFSPAMVHCPNCQQHVTTKIQHKVGKTSFLLCYLSALLGCVGGCCLLPFFLNYFKDTCHYCPSCHTEIQNVPRI